MTDAMGSPNRKKSSDETGKVESLSDHLHKKAFDNSLQANIVSLPGVGGKIIIANPAACKLLGYSNKELLTKSRADIFVVKESNFKKMIKQRKAKGKSTALVTVIKKNGNTIPCELTSAFFIDDNGIENSITTIADITQSIEKQKNIDSENEKIVSDNIDIAQSKSDNRQAGNNDWIKSINKSSYDVIWDWDIASGMISFGNTYDKIFGYKLTANKLDFKQWLSLFQPEEGNIVERKIKSALETELHTWEDSYKFTCPDGSTGQVISRANIIRDVDGKAIRMIGVIHDTTKLQRLEESLELEIKIKEKQIIEAIVEAKEMERSDLGKELHDNINQLLGISKLYLDMARKDIKNGDIYLIHSSEYTQSAIEEIRKLSKGLTVDTLEDFGLCGAIEEISRDTMETYPAKIHCVLDESLETRLSEKFKLNTFRILQEHLNNIIKHASASEIHIAVSQTPDAFMLSITDDGIGFDTTKKVKGIGIKNINSRAELYKGNANFISEKGKGCMLVVTFPFEYADFKGAKEEESKVSPNI